TRYVEIVEARRPEEGEPRRSNAEQLSSQARSRIRQSRSFWYILSLFSFTCALMSKPMAVTLPFVLLLLDFWPLSRIRAIEMGVMTPTEAIAGDRIGDRKLKIRNAAALLTEKLPFFLLAALDCAATVWAQRSVAIASLKTFPFPSRLANALVSCVLYLWQTI